MPSRFTRSSVKDRRISQLTAIVNNLQRVAPDDEKGQVILDNAPADISPTKTHGKKFLNSSEAISAGCLKHGQGLNVVENEHLVVNYIPSVLGGITFDLSSKSG